MSRNKPYSGAALLSALLALAIGAALIACAPSVPRLDLTTVAACPAEDGPGMSGPVPCTWDTERDGNGHGGSVIRWYLYADHCPVNTTQDRRLVECIGRSDWTGGIEGEGRTN